MLLFYLDYHFAQPSSPLMVVGGHTYYTHPPALSLSQRDPVSAKIVAIALGLTLLAGTIDLTVRLFRSTTVPGVAAITAGGLCMLFSLFGLLWGLLGIGTAGLLVILSGLPMTRTGTEGSGQAGAIGPPAAWYPDPTDRPTCATGTAPLGARPSPRPGGSPSTLSEHAHELV